MNLENPSNQDNNVQQAKTQMPFEPIIILENDKALTFEFTFSSGAGGQNVNKNATKAVLYFTITDSQSLTNAQKRVLLCKECTPTNNHALHNLQNKINARGDIIISNQETKSQLQNKSRAVAILNLMLNEALKPRKKRKQGMTHKAKAKKRRLIEDEKLRKFKEKKQKQDY